MDVVRRLRLQGLLEGKLAVGKIEELGRCCYLDRHEVELGVETVTSLNPGLLEQFQIFEFEGFSSEEKNQFKLV